MRWEAGISLAFKVSFFLNPETREVEGEIWPHQTISLGNYRVEFDRGFALDVGVRENDGVLVFSGTWTEPQSSQTYDPGTLFQRLAAFSNAQKAMDSVKDGNDEKWSAAFKGLQDALRRLA